MWNLIYLLILCRILKYYIKYSDLIFFNNIKLKRRPPIVGYTGFQSGVKAENMFGKSFKDITTDVIFNDLSK